MAGLGEKIKQTFDRVGGKNHAAGKRILIVATSHEKLGNTDELTGSWIEELAAPYYIFKDAGAHVVVASLKGGKIPFDKASFADNAVTDHVRRYLADEELKQHVENSIAIKDITGSFDALFVPGGHGIIYDGPNDATFNALGNKFLAEGKVVSAVCHGPSGIVNFRFPDGSSIFKGKKVTGFSNAEEDAVARTPYVPFLLEDKVKELGGLYEAGPNWQPKAVADGKLVTGQNPASSAPLAELVLKALGV